jgi:hypothetical protein
MDFHECLNNTDKGPFAAAAGESEVLFADVHAASVETGFKNIVGAMPAGHAAAGIPGGPNQNMSYMAALALCEAAEGCWGITFESSTATPSGIVNVYFKKEATVNIDLSHVVTLLRRPHNA